MAETQSFTDSIIKTPYTIFQKMSCELNRMTFRADNGMMFTSSEHRGRDLQPVLSVAIKAPQPLRLFCACHISTAVPCLFVMAWLFGQLSSWPPH